MVYCVLKVLRLKYIVLWLQNGQVTGVFLCNGTFVYLANKKKKKKDLSLLKTCTTIEKEEKLLSFNFWAYNETSA